MPEVANDPRQRTGKPRRRASPSEAKQPQELISEYGIPALLCLNFIHIVALGTIYVAEIAIIPIALMARATLPKGDGVNRIVAKLALISLAVALVSFAYTAVSDEALNLRSGVKGASVWVLFAFDLALAGTYLRPSKYALVRVRRLLSSLAISQLAAFFLDPVPGQRETPWKFGFALPFAILAACAVTRQRVDSSRPYAPGFAATTFAGLSVVNFLLSYRSMSLFCAVVAIAVLAKAIKGKARARNPLGAAAFGVVVVLVFLLGITFYQKEAQAGVLGEAARVKAQQQGSSAIAVIVSSRPEAFFLLPAILSSPLTGHGADGVVSQQDSDTGIRLLRALGDNEVMTGALPGKPLPVHSHLLGSWALYGVVAAILWLIVFRRAIAEFFMQLRGDRVPIILLPAIILAWDVLFSPFGADKRVQDSIFIAIIAGSAVQRRLAGSGS